MMCDEERLRLFGAAKSRKRSSRTCALAFLFPPYTRGRAQVWLGLEGEGEVKGHLVIVSVSR